MFAKSLFTFWKLSLTHTLTWKRTRLIILLCFKITWWLWSQLHVAEVVCIGAASVIGCITNNAKEFEFVHTFLFPFILQCYWVQFWLYLWWKRKKTSIFLKEKNLHSEINGMIFLMSWTIFSIMYQVFNRLCDNFSTFADVLNLCRIPILVLYTG